MREIARLLALAIIAFMIVAMAVTLDNPALRDSIGQRIGLTGGTKEAVTGRITERDTVLRVRRPHLNTWVGLQGFPSNISISFPLPREAGLVGGQLQLDLESQLIEQGDGLLRVLVNGQERDAIVLERGRRTHRLTYDLAPSDLVAGSLLVRLSANGTTNYGQICPTNVTNLGAAIEVLPSSALLLQLGKPLTGAAAIALLLPDPLHLDISGAPSLAAWGSQFLTRQGVDAITAVSPASDLIKVEGAGSEPLSVNADRALTLTGSNGIKAIGTLRGAALPGSYGRQWPLPVETLTSDLLTHTFRGSSRWTLRYKLADLPEGRAPANLKLSLRTSRLQEGNDWTLRVLLNGSLIHSANYPGADDTISLDVPLPPALQGLRNEIVATLVDNTPNQGICRAGPEAAAQLLPASRLDAASTAANDRQTLVMALARGVSVGVRPQTGATLASSDFLSGMLDLILPLNADVTFGEMDGEVRIETVQGERLQALLSSEKPKEAQNAYLLFPSSGDRPDAIAVARLGEAGTTPAAAEVGPMALLVTW